MSSSSLYILLRCSRSQSTALGIDSFRASRSSSLAESRPWNFCICLMHPRASDMKSDIFGFLRGSPWEISTRDMFMVFSAIIMYLIYRCVKFIHQSIIDYKQKGPTVWPLLGTTVEHLVHYHRLHEWLLGHFQSAGKLTLSAPVIGGKVFYYTVDPASVKHILKNNFPNYPKGGLFRERMNALLGDGIFNSDGDVWRSQRKTASSEFSLKSLRDFSADTFKDNACKLAGLCVQQHLDLGEAVDMQDLYMRTTLDSIGKIGFGVELGSLPKRFPLQSNEFAKAFDTASQILTLRFIDPFWKIRRLFRIGAEAQLWSCIDTVERLVYKVIAIRKREYNLRQSQTTVGAAPAKSDIISRFLDLSGSGSHEPMSDKFLRDVVLNFIIAGRDTTAVTMTWMTYMLCQHPDISNRLWEELVQFQRKNDPDYKKRNGTSLWTDVEEKLGEDVSLEKRQNVFQQIMENRVRQFSNLLNYESLKHLVYLQAVITETLRLYPAVPLDPKGILNDDVLPDGTRLKAGQTIAYSPWCMARMTSLWGPDAMDFNPDRWIQNGAVIQESEFKFATFQAGYRTCLGRDSAYLQLKITMAILCRFFEFHRADSSVEEKTYRMMATLMMAGGLHARVRLRDE